MADGGWRIMTRRTWCREPRRVVSTEMLALQGRREADEGRGRLEGMSPGRRACPGARAGTWRARDAPRSVGALPAASRCEGDHRRSRGQRLAPTARAA